METSGCYHWFFYGFTALLLLCELVKKRLTLKFTVNNLVHLSKLYIRANIGRRKKLQ